jgi:hypothetical protein
MPAIIKSSGPKGAVRPFMPTMAEDVPAERIAHALEHIAVALSAIDHNIEVLVKQNAAR